MSLLQKKIFSGVYKPTTQHWVTLSITVMSLTLIFQCLIIPDLGK